MEELVKGIRELHNILGNGRRPCPFLRISTEVEGAMAIAANPYNILILGRSRLDFGP